MIIDKDASSSMHLIYLLRKLVIRSVLYVAVFILFYEGSFPKLSYSQNVDWIRIYSSQSVLWGHSEDRLTVVHKSGAYYANGELIDGKLIENLLDAIDQPTITALDVCNIGITQNWLNENAASAVKENASFVYVWSRDSTDADSHQIWLNKNMQPMLQRNYSSIYSWSDKQRKVLISSFKNLEIIKEAFRSYFLYDMDHEYPLNRGKPSFSLEIMMEDSQTFILGNYQS